MDISFSRKILKSCFNSIIICLNIIFGIHLIFQPLGLQAQGVPNLSVQTALNLPAPGAIVTTSPDFMPVLVKGIKIHPKNPLEFNFIVDQGDWGKDSDTRSWMLDTRSKETLLKKEAEKLVKYFLAALTTPEEDLWVNLSPHEPDRIIPEEFGQTEMGRDLLAQDYLLKQLMASSLYPEHELGKTFWAQVRQKAYELYGVQDIPVETFHKVWVVPDTARVFENGDVAFIVESRLKVMLEEDYLAREASSVNREAKESNPVTQNRDTLHKIRYTRENISSVSSQILRDLILPKLEREVNEGQNFAPLRQIYHSLILAAWFKQALKESLLGQIYVNQNKVEGIKVENPKIKQKIYQQYLEAYKKGVYSYIKEEYDPTVRQVIPKKYFSGGMAISVLRPADPGIPIPLKVEVDADTAQLTSDVMSPSGQFFDLSVRVEEPEVGAGADAAMMAIARPKSFLELGISRGEMIRRFIMDVNAPPPYVIYGEGNVVELIPVYPGVFTEKKFKELLDQLAQSEELPLSDQQLRSLLSQLERLAWETQRIVPEALDFVMIRNLLFRWGFSYEQIVEVLNILLEAIQGQEERFQESLDGFQQFFYTVLERVEQKSLRRSPESIFSRTSFIRGRRNAITSQELEWIRTHSSEFSAILINNLEEEQIVRKVLIATFRERMHQRHESEQGVSSYVYPEALRDLRFISLLENMPISNDEFRRMLILIDMVAFELQARSPDALSVAMMEELLVNRGFIYPQIKGVLASLMEAMLDKEELFRNAEDGEFSEFFYQVFSQVPSQVDGEGVRGNGDDDGAMLASSAVEPLKTKRSLSSYLDLQGNETLDQRKAGQIVKNYHIRLLALGAGLAEVEYEIARLNPNIGVLATDLYPLEGNFAAPYKEFARAWRDRRLLAQKQPRDNLVALRAPLEILSYLPDNSLDYILLVNPISEMRQELYNLLINQGLLSKLRKGGRVIYKPKKLVAIRENEQYRFGDDFLFSRNEPVFLGVHINNIAKHHFPSSVNATFQWQNTLVWDHVSDGSSQLAGVGDGAMLSEVTKDTPPSFAAAFAGVLAERGLTIHKAAELLGVSPSSIAKWRTGELHPSLRNLRRIKNKLGVQLTDPQREGRRIPPRLNPKRVKFPTYLKNLRERKGWSQNYVAHAIGIHINTYQSIEEGRRPPHHSELISLMRLFDEDFTALLSKPQFKDQPVGEFLRELRVFADLTQAQVAEYLGYSSPTMVSRIERGEMLPTPEKLAVYSQLFDVDLAVLEHGLSKDSAMLNQTAPIEPIAAEETPHGGVDLTALQIKRDGRGVALPVEMQNIDEINIKGLIPVFIDFQPVRDLRSMFNDGSESPQG